MSIKNLVYRWGQALVDFIVITLIYIFSYILLGNNVDDLPNKLIFCALIYSGINVIANAITFNYRLYWVYQLTKNFIRLFFVFFISSVVIFITNAILLHNQLSVIEFNVFFVALICEVCYLFASRSAIKLTLSYYFEKRKDNKKEVPLEKRRTIIVGAGSLGAMILNEINKKPELGFEVVGFLDDNINKIGVRIEDKKVLGKLDEVDKYIDKYKVKDVIIAMSSKNNARIVEFTNSLDYKNIEVHVVPDQERILSNKDALHIRKIEIADLLGRDPIELDNDGLNDFINNKTILVTGGGGSIGSEICRQVLNYNPKCLIVFDIYENNVYELQTEINIKYRTHPELNKPRIEYLIGSVRDKKRLNEVFKEYKPNIVFHAAAHKHVPLMEDSPREAIKNNIMGTYNVAEYSMKYKVEKMVLISTDKAVNPTNVMGASKRFCEMVVEAFQSKSEYTSYSMVRFGNVLGSNGSVIPLFKSQIEKGGPLTVTSDKINRFFMTIPEACGLVIQSGAFAQGGEKFILDMGEPVKIIDLARKMIKLSGLEEGKDIDIVITGLRPGEKIYEELLLDKSKAEKTDNEKIFIERSKHTFSVEQMDEIINKLMSMELNNKTMLNYLNEIEVLKEDKVCV